MITYLLADMPNRDELLALGIDQNARVIRSIVHPKTEGVSIKAILTNQFREPMKGEWYLSGAIPEAYRAINDLSTKYRILKLVLVRQTVKEEIIKEM